jgi:DNA-binding NtrC family response regulator
MVDDDLSQRAAWKRVLGMRRRVFAAASLVEAREICRTETVAVAIVDAYLDGESGVDFLYELKEFFPAIRSCLLTGGALDEIALEALASGVRVLAVKPISPRALLDEVETHEGRAPKVLRVAPLRLSGIEQSAPMIVVEREHILATLLRTNGNKTLAARQLGISRQALHDKLKAIRVDEQRPESGHARKRLHVSFDGLP